MSTSAAKTAPFDLGYFKYFFKILLKETLLIACKQLFGESEFLFAIWASDMCEMFLEIRTSHPGVFCKNDPL